MFSFIIVLPFKCHLYILFINYISDSISMSFNISKLRKLFFFFILLQTFPGQFADKIKI